MHRKCLYIMMCICTSMFLTACTLITEIDAETYRIEKNNGEYYMHFTREYDDNLGSKEITIPRFSSVAEMKEKILSGQLTSAEVRHLRYKESQDDYVLPLYNLDRLQDFVLPEGMELMYIDFVGKSYYCVFLFESRECVMSVCSKEAFEKDVAYVQRSLERNTVISEEKISERNATVFICHTKGDFYNRFKRIEYVIEDDNKKLSVHENYTEPSDAVPRSTWILGKQNGAYFSLIMSDCRPSYEWISSLGLKKLEDNTIPIVICISVLLVAGCGFLLISVRRKKKAPVQTSPEAVSNTAAPQEDT